MKNTILRTNATPIYAFLSFIASNYSPGELENQIKILDCGAGGPVPPLALFCQHGFDAYGIDISDRQLEQAREYCQNHHLQIDLRQADMRKMPFDDETFDCVYEHYSMCHLSKQETTRAISEMHRITKNQGLCFLGVISTDSWPKSLFGEEHEPGEYWTEEEHHSMFTNQEADDLVSAWEILSKEKRVLYLRDAAEKISIDTWMELFDSGYTKDSWRNLYDNRANMFNYTHIYYILKKR